MSTRSDTAQKLTKKQRKGIAFRQKKGKGRAVRPEPEDVPESENIDAQTDNVENSESLNIGFLKASINGKGEGKDKQREGEARAADAERLLKKRKRAEAGGDVEPDASSNPPKSKKRKSKPSEANENANSEETKKKESELEQQKTRYILFVGNLKYTTSKEAIQAHFAHCDPPPTVRLLTPKSTSTTKSKGCAFLEFTHRNALQQALKLHHSSLDDRQINVELTAGGGGKSATRLDKVRGRNRELEAQRTKRQQKGSTKADARAPPAISGQSQRHSSTSGAIETPAARRTWSVPEAHDEGLHRGGVKHSKKRGNKKGKGTKGRDWSTGVNAIPVG